MTSTGFFTNEGGLPSTSIVVAYPFCAPALQKTRSRVHTNV